MFDSFDAGDALHDGSGASSDKAADMTAAAASSSETDVLSQLETEPLLEPPVREGKPAASEISRVTVFTDAAEITRSAKVVCAAGKSVFLLTPLSQTVRADSLNVSASGAAVISARYDIDALADAPCAEERASLMTAYELAVARLEELADKSEALQGEYEVLKSGCTSHGDSARSPQSIKEIAGLFAAEAGRIKDGLRALKVERKQAETEKKRLEAALRGEAEQRRSAGVVTLELYSERGGEADISLKYTDEAAWWEPLYDVRTDGPASRCALTLKGNISQNTGEDWNELPVTLATGAAVSGGSCPELRPQRLGVRQPPQARALGARSLMKTMAFDEESLTEDSCETSLGAANDLGLPSFMQAKAVGGALNVEYELQAAYTVKTGGETTADVISRELDAEYTYKTAPKLRETVYLTAKAKDWREAAPLAGRAAVFVSGTYVGGTFLSPEAGDDELALSLGSCSDIDIKRSPESRFTNKADLLGKTRYSVEWTITARSRRGDKAALEILDQIPVSADSQIEITPDEISGAALDAETGFLRWSLELASGESRELKVRYSVSFPKKIIPLPV